MVEEANVYCGSCGEALSASARFCRACGAPQDLATQEAEAHPPPAPSLAPARPPQRSPLDLPSVPQPPAVAPGAGTLQRARSSTTTLLAIAGGIGMCFMVLYTIVYYPLHYHLDVFFGESLHFGDLLAFCSGVAAILIGGLALRRGPSGTGRFGAALIAAGLPTLALTVFWAFPETFNLDYYFSKPAYFGFVFFSPLGNAHVGHAYENGHLQVPLLVSSAAVALGGCLMLFARGRSTGPPTWR